MGRDGGRRCPSYIYRHLPELCTDTCSAPALVLPLGPTLSLVITLTLSPSQVPELFRMQWVRAYADDGSDEQRCQRIATFLDGQLGPEEDP